MEIKPLTGKPLGWYVAYHKIEEFTKTKMEVYNTKCHNPSIATCNTTFSLDYT